MVTPFSPSTSLLPKGWQVSSGSKKVLQWFLKKKFYLSQCKFYFINRNKMEIALYPHPNFLINLHVIFRRKRES